jgi:hypothetical protein
MEFKELLLLAEKQKWMQRFRKAYSDGCKDDSPLFYGENVKFIVAIENDVELGFIRLVDKTYRFDPVTTHPVWSASDAFVKIKYRSMGVLRKLFLYTMENHFVGVCYLTRARYEKLKSYYESLGFTRVSNTTSGEMVWLFTEESWTSINAVKAIPPN